MVYCKTGLGFELAVYDLLIKKSFSAHFDKLLKRFKKVERALSEKGYNFETAGQEELNLIWERAKKP